MEKNYNFGTEELSLDEMAIIDGGCDTCRDVGKIVGVIACIVLICLL